MNRLAKAIDRVTRSMDHPSRLGKAAVYKVVTYGVVDPDTGIQAVNTSTKRVTVRPWPISIEDADRFLRAGLADVHARWCMRASYHDSVKAEDVIEVSGFEYEILENPTAQLDEFGIDWIIYTRRKRF